LYIQGKNPTKGIERPNIYVSANLYSVKRTQQRELKGDIYVKRLISLLQNVNPTKGIERNFHQQPPWLLRGSEPNKGN